MKRKGGEERLFIGRFEWMFCQGFGLTDDV